MRTLLVVTRHPATASAIEAALDSAQYQLIVKADVAEGEFLLVRGAIDAAILELELSERRAIRALNEVKHYAPNCPLIVVTGSRQAENEEEAYLHGVHHVLVKPVRGRLLGTLLQRLFLENGTEANLGTPAEISPPVQAAPSHPLAPSAETGRALFALRRFSTLLTHGLDAAELLRQFLLLLREMMGINRAIVFLRKPSNRAADGPVAVEDRWLRSACSVGLDHSVLDHFALSLGAGIGGYLHRHGRILRAGGPEAQGNREIVREFQILGAQLAVPILDRNSLLGVAIFDERLTGEPFTGDDLALLFHLLEEVGLAIRNAWSHGQLRTQHAMVAEILGRLASGCVVIGGGMEILHANGAANEIFRSNRGESAFDFNDLPQALGSMAFTVIKTGVAVAPFRHEFLAHPGRIFRMAIVPFQTGASGHTDAALLTVEEITEHERAQKLESEASALRLIKSMAEHLAHEIGNAVVPLSTHQQMMKELAADPEFQESLSDALAGGVKRISRLASQMNFLAREWSVEFREAVPISQLLVEAFHEAHANHPGKKVAQLAFNRTDAPWKVAGDPKALRHAFAEIILNALQANPDAPTVSVRLQENTGSQDELQVQVEDSGTGFTEEAAARATEPFFSTRNVGMGIGLTVTRKIIESHHGRVEIPTTQSGGAGIVRISLPIHDRDA